MGFLKLAATDVSAFCNRTFLGILPYWNKGHSDVLKTKRSVQIRSADDVDLLHFSAIKET